MVLATVGFREIKGLEKQRVRESERKLEKARERAKEELQNRESGTVYVCRRKAQWKATGGLAKKAWRYY